MGRAAAPLRLLSAEFARVQAEGEVAGVPAATTPRAAAASYRHALEIARSPWEQCSARLWLGRSYSKAGMTAERRAQRSRALQECGDVSDADGVPLALYAAERLLASAMRSDGPAGRLRVAACQCAATAAMALAERGVHSCSRCCAGCRVPAAAEALRTLARRFATSSRLPPSSRTRTTRSASFSGRRDRRPEISPGWATATNPGSSRSCLPHRLPRPWSWPCRPGRSFPRASRCA